MITCRAEMDGACPLPKKVRLVEPEVPELLCAELDRTARDPLYAEALALAVTAP